VSVGVASPSRIFAPGLLDGHVAVITGGGTGLGKAAAAELIACGASVVIAGRRAEVLEEAAADLGESCVPVVADIRSPDDCSRIVSVAVGRFGRLDLLVNNAGGQYFVPAESIALKGWNAVWRLNVGGTVCMTRAAVDGAMREAGRGMVVNVTLSPHHGLAGMTHSSAARAAVEAVTRSWAAEFASAGVAVCAVAAGHFETEALKKYPETVRENVARTVPLQRLGDEREHAWLVALLASPLGPAFSGSVITLDGARDNWFGPWPPPEISATGEVPTEERRPSIG
jgi:citronellol/citronellal dehydrogenase